MGRESEEELKAMTKYKTANPEFKNTSVHVLCMFVHALGGKFHTEKINMYIQTSNMHCGLKKKKSTFSRTLP